MEIKVVGQIIFFKIFLRMYDVWSDWYITYLLMMGYSFTTGIECKETYYQNHIYIGIISMILPCLSLLFHFGHWWEIENIKDVGYGKNGEPCQRSFCKSGLLFATFIYYTLAS